MKKMLFFLLFSLFFLFGCGLHIDKQEQNETCSVVKDTEIISDLFSAYSKHFQYLIEEVFYSTTTDVCIAKLKVDVGENTIYHRLYDIKNKKILTEYLECYPPMYEEPTQDKDCEERYLAYEKVLETLQGKSFQSQLSFKPWLIRKEHSLFEKEKVKTMLLNASNPILNHLKEKNFTGLANYVENSLLFLPYPTHATNEESISFSSIELETLVSSPKNYTRGMWAGSGEPIKLTFDEYYNRFIWDYNYFLVPQIFVNEEVVSRGNTSVNLAELFPGNQIIEYHFPGLKEEYAGMDWTSLYLVLEEKEGKWILKAIAHGEWTP